MIHYGTLHGAVQKRRPQVSLSMALVRTILSSNQLAKEFPDWSRPREAQGERGLRQLGVPTAPTEGAHQEATGG